MRLRLEKSDWMFAANFGLAIIAIAAPLWMWRADLSAKEVDISLIGSFALVASASDASQSLSILYNGKELVEPFTSIISIKNSGAKPIQASDFDGPIKITLAKPAKLLRSQIVRRVPESLEPVVLTNERMLTLDPMLLNPGDLMSLEILTSGGNPQFSSRGRIAGVPDVVIEKTPAESHLKLTFYGIRLDSPLGLLILIYTAFGSTWAWACGMMTFKLGKHSFVLTLLGSGGIAFLLGSNVGMLLRVGFGFSSFNALIVGLAAMGAGYFTYLIAKHLLPATR
jgi:hypothetical protein